MPRQTKSSSNVLQRVGYLALMLLVDETHETLMMITNSMKMDLQNFRDHWILINALTALANICSASMARDLATGAP
jgi:AP-1 complex subunit gamma-1